MKTCSRCNLEKLIEDFTRRAASKDGYTAACTECLKGQKRIDYVLEPEKTMQRVRKNHKLRKDNDHVYRRAWNQWRYAKEINRVPKWVQFARDMLPKYRELMEKAPSDWTIDHIVPMQGKNVSGLHVPSNLQVLPQRDNSGKGNFFIPELLT